MTPFGRTAAIIMTKSEFLEEEITDDATQNVVRQLVVESERKYRTLVDNALVGIYIIDQTQIHFANPHLQNLLGYSEDERSGLSLQDIIEPRFCKEVYERISKRMAGETSQDCSEFKMICKDGRIIDVRSRGVRCMFHGKPAILGTIIDVTEQKQTEARLIELETTLDEVPIPIIRIDTAGRITYANNQVSSILGCDRSEIFGNPIARLVQLQNSEESIAEVLMKHRRTQWRGLVRLTGTDGQVPEYTAIARPSISGNGVNVGTTLHLLEPINQSVNGNRKPEPCNQAFEES